MKIAITVSSITPGSGLSKYILTLIKILNVNRNEIFVITTHGKDDVYEKSQVQQCANIKYYSLGKNSKLQKYFTAIRLLRDLQPDVIINNYNAVFQYILPFISHKTKVVHIIHNNTEDFYRIAAINARYVHGWIAPTPALVNYFNEYTTSRYTAKIKYIPHGVEDGINRTQRNINKTELSFVGVHYEHKGVLVLPPIIKQLKEKGLDFHFNIVGKGKLTDNIKEQLKDEIEKGEVTFTGVISPEEVYQIQSQTDIFVYPTHIDAFGLVIAEAMINGAVPVVTLLPGITDELVEEGKNGFLVVQDDVDAFVENIYLLATNRELLARMSEDAIERAKTRFSLDVMQKNYLNYLEDIVK